MYRLIRTAIDILGNSVEPSSKICDRCTVWIVIIHTETTSEIDIPYLDSVFLEISYNFIDSLALKSKYLTHTGNLRSDMEVQTEEFDVLALCQNLNQLVKLVL